MLGRMGGWMDGWVGGWIGGWMDGWVGGWMSGWMDGWVDGWVGGWMSGWMGGWVGGWVVGWVVNSRFLKLVRMTWALCWGSIDCLGSRTNPTLDWYCNSFYPDDAVTLVCCNYHVFSAKTRPHTLPLSTKRLVFSIECFLKGPEEFCLIRHWWKILFCS